MSQVEETVLEQQEAVPEIAAPEDFSDVDCADDESGLDLTYAIPAGNEPKPTIVGTIAQLADEIAKGSVADKLESIGLSRDFLDDADSSSVVVAENLPKKNKKQPAAQPKQPRSKPASLSSLNQLARVFNDGEPLESHIKYVFFDSAVTIMDNLNSVTSEQWQQLHDANPDVPRVAHNIRATAVDVMINPMNCKHNWHGLNALLGNFLPKLVEADAAIGEDTLHTLGSYTFAGYTSKNYPEVQKFVFNLYVQFNRGHKKRLSNGVIAKPLHIKATQSGLSKMLKMFDRNVNVGIMFFGEDRLAPTDWIDIEPILENVCRSLNRTITVFVPSRVLVNRTNKLGVNIANAARARGLMV